MTANYAPMKFALRGALSLLTVCVFLFVITLTPKTGEKSPYFGLLPSPRAAKNTHQSESIRSKVYQGAQQESEDSSHDVATVIRPQNGVQLQVTDSFLREYIKKHGSFPEQCELNKTDLSWTGCSFPPLEIKSCLESKGIKRIVVFGDSQGRRFSDAVAKVIHKQTSTGCRKTKFSKKREARGHLSYTYYITDPSWKYELDFTKAFCTTCDGCIRTCDGIAEIEYNGVQSLNGKTITIPPSANTFLEFLLKFYLQKNPPDLVLFEIPFNHIKQYISIEDFRTQFVYVLDIIKQNLKGVKSVMFLPGMFEHEYKRRDNMQYYMKKFLNHLASEQIYFLNKELAQIFRDENMVDDTRFSTFVNLINSTSTLMDYCLDGIHYKDELYVVIVEALFGMFCHKD